MVAVGILLVRMLCDLFKPRPRLEAEILILRHQLNVDALCSQYRRTETYRDGRRDSANQSHSIAFVPDQTMVAAQLPQVQDAMGNYTLTTSFASHPRPT